MSRASQATRRTQKRGEERRQRLLDSAASLLARREIAEISLEDIARNADIPVTSAYHFYPDKHRLLTALAARYGEAFEQIVVKPLPAAQIGRWEDVIERLIDRAVRYYRDNPAARKLLIDGKSPSDIKLADRYTIVQSARCSRRRSRVISCCRSSRSAPTSSITRSRSSTC